MHKRSLQSRKIDEGPDLQIGLDTRGDMTVVELTGQVSSATSIEVGDILLRCLSDQPTAVLVDLLQLQTAEPDALTTLVTAARSSALWSGVPLMLIAHSAIARRLRSTAIEEFAQVHPTMPAGIAAAKQAPPRTTAVRELAAHPRSARICRRHVARTCTDWSCEHLSENAMAVSEELVSNAVLHSSGPLTHRLEFRHDALTIAVTDHTPVPPIPVEPTADDIPAHGYGLRIVAAHAAAWGSTPTTTDGKTVWAVLR